MSKMLINFKCFDGGVLALYGLQLKLKRSVL